VIFYTGVPESGDNAHWHDFWQKKLATMGRQGIQLFTRSLRYRNKVISLPGGGQYTFLCGEEKGIDVRIALDIVRFSHRRECDPDRQSDLRRLPRSSGLSSLTSSNAATTVFPVPVAAITRLRQWPCALLSAASASRMRS
jgi:hypothetical protein